MEPDLIQNWVLEFVNLEETYKVFTKLFDSLDTYTEFTHLLMVKKMAVFWPLVIKTFALDQIANKKQFCLVMRLMEVFAVRGYALSGIRSDAGLSTLYASARDFKGNYKELQDLLFSMSSWWKIGLLIVLKVLLSIIKTELMRLIFFGVMKIIYAHRSES